MKLSNDCVLMRLLTQTQNDFFVVVINHIDKSHNFLSLSGFPFFLLDTSTPSNYEFFEVRKHKIRRGKIRLQIREIRFILYLFK
ncbi:hypothetical protein ACE6H2_013089 [Prunus campanulata]